MCKAINDMVKDGEQRGERRGERKGERKGIRKGERRGIQKGANRINLLNGKLLEDGRLDDLKRSVTDHKFQRALLEEYAL